MNLFSMAFLISAALFVSSCGSSKPPPCDMKALDSSLAAANETNAHASIVVAAGLADACAARMPKPLAGLLREVASSGEWRLASVAQGLADLMVQFPDLWPKACDKTAAQMARDFQQLAAASGPADPLCPAGADALQLVSDADREGSVRTVIAALVHAWLRDEGLDGSKARSLARRLLAPR